MDRLLKRQDNIDSYVRGEMNDDRRRDFEQLMADDHQLADEVTLLQRVTTCAADISSKRTKVAEWERAYADNDGEQGGHRHDNKYGWTRRVVAVVVAAAACVAVAFLLFNESGQSPAGGSPLDGLDLGLAEPAVRDGSASDAVAVMISNNDYEGAVALIAADSEELEQERTMTLGDTAMGDEERQYMLDLINDQAYHLQWLQIIALVGSHDESQAVSLLNDFVTVDGRHRQSAEQLLLRLKK